MLNLNRIQKKKIKELASKENIILAVMYGSFAVGRETADSDVDIAILRKGESDIADYFSDYGRLTSYFNEIFPNRRIDLVPLRGLDPLFFYQIMSKGALLYGDRHLFNSMKVRAFMRHIDAQPLLKTEHLLVLKRQNFLLRK